MRRVVVTGGGTGIGRAIVEKFISSERAELFVVGRRKEPLTRVAAEFPDHSVHPLIADLTDPGDVRRVAEELATAPVDVLVNNAGSSIRDRKPGFEGMVDRHRRMIESNLLSAMILTEALWDNLRRPGARIVNISSIAAQRGGGDAYAAAKAGMCAWGLELARKGAPDAITVNTVTAGYIAGTEFFDESGRSPRHDELVAETLLGRAGRPEDIAPMVYFLASDDASWITGQLIGVNGGAVLGR